MALVMKVMKIILIAIIFTTTTSAYGEPKDIFCPIKFSKEAKFVAWSSVTHGLYENIPRRYVLEFTQYAKTFKEFADIYGTFTLNATGVAFSDEIFGNGAKNKFNQPMKYDTRNFQSPPLYRRYVDVSESKFWTYSTEVHIEIGFQRDGKTLFVIPYLRAEIVSHGFTERTLLVGLNINSITFHRST